MRITEATLKYIAPRANSTLVKNSVGYMNHYLQMYGMTQKLVIQHALAQWAHETDGFRTFVEYGNEDYFKAYDGRMGNVNPGDGAKYRGRGMTMITGYDNYKRLSNEVAVDFVDYPHQLSAPIYAVQAACFFWNRYNISQWALKDDILKVTKIINGGYNGLQDRKNYLKLAKEIVTEDLTLYEEPQSEKTDLGQDLPSSTPPTPSPSPTPTHTVIKPASQPDVNTSIPDTNPSTPAKKVSTMPKISLNNINIGSIIAGFGGLGFVFSVLRHLPAEYIEYGFYSAVAMGAGLLVQAFLPVDQAVTLEKLIANGIIPAVNRFDPPIEPQLDQIATGLRHAVEISEATKV